MRVLLAVLDGAADTPNAQLAFRTPLQAARKPFLDNLAQNSRAGLLRIAGDIAPESDVGVLSIFGINALKLQTRRSALEALGVGETFKNGMLALRANFATLNENQTKILDRRVGRNLSTEEAKRIAQELNARIYIKGINTKLVATSGHRAVLLAKRKRAFSRDISNTDPAYEMTRAGITTANSNPRHLLQQCKPLKHGARETAKFVNEYLKQAHAILATSKINEYRKIKGALPANGLLFRDAETRLKSPRKKMQNWTVIADMPLEIGIGRFLGMHVKKMPAFFSPRDYEARAEVAVEELRSRNVYVHIKGPDVYGHDGDAIGKTKCIEEIDSHFFAKVSGLDKSKVRIAVTSDHATPCGHKAHSNDPVPFMISGAGVKNKTGIQWFGEKECAKGETIPATSLMSLLLAKQV
ncbi:MAG TPA: alkaline phosphatase family protein [Candidatus Norongarragalinales archaeon]|jgi:2,3-bisphosphoglycerate-independent phosphoglycerate mutase|nr:alkaline phosphatase family protein [Candidatus Norongarragalinales archaeon]